MKFSEKNLISCEQRLITEPGVIPRAFDINRKLNHHYMGKKGMERRTLIVLFNVIFARKEVEKNSEQCEMTIL